MSDMCILSDLNANSQVMRAAFLRRRKSLIICQRKRGQGESISQSFVVSLLRESVHFFKGKLGAQFEYVSEMHVPG
jgi:hypothetical protein